MYYCFCVNCAEGFLILDYCLVDFELRRTKIWSPSWYARIYSFETLSRIDTCWFKFFQIQNGKLICIGSVKTQQLTGVMPGKKIYPSKVGKFTFIPFLKIGNMKVYFTTKLISEWITLFFAFQRSFAPQRCLCATFTVFLWACTDILQVTWQFF